MKRTRQILVILSAAVLAISASTANAAEPIPGYTYSSASIPQSPVSLEDLALLKTTLLFGEEDEKYLRMSYDVLEPQVDAILDVWYGFVGSNEHLLYYFTHKETEVPIGDYLKRVRARFGKWILDTARAEYDQDWLNYQHLIGLRHHRIGKNTADDVDAVAHIHYRYLPALQYPVTTTLKPFLANDGHSSEDVDKMHQAWIKSVMLQIILWSHPYIKEGDF